MSTQSQKTLKSLATRLDQLPFDRLNAALSALVVYELKTDQWIADWQNEVENRGEEFEEDDAYWDAYDDFCSNLYLQVVEDYQALTDDLDLVMEVLSDKWEQIPAFMTAEANRNHVVEMMC